MARNSANIRPIAIDNTPLELLLSIIPSVPRHALDRLVERAIERMDEEDGDAEIEANGDELDGSLAEDDFHNQNENWKGHPGCPIADPGGIDPYGGEGADWAFHEPPSRPPEAARKSREAQTRRIRRERCIPIYRRAHRWSGDAGREIARHVLATEPTVPSLRTMKRRHRQLRRKRRL